MGHKPVVRFLSEFIATAALVFLGCMGCITSTYYGNSHLQMCLNFGMVILITVQVFHTVTGPHMNPAITLAAVVYERVDPTMGGVYMLAQMLGGAIGYALLAALVPSQEINRPLSEHGLCVTVPIKQINLFQAVVIEFILTAFLILVCCGIWDPKNASFGDGIPIRFGFAIFCLACTGGPFTGASMNPARSFGPALWHLDFTDHWVYYVGPMLGSAAASVGYKLTFKTEPEGGAED